MMRKILACLSLVALAVIAGLGAWPFRPVEAAQGPTVALPRFQADPAWPKLPNNWVVGEVSSVAVDRRDHVWVLQRPRSVPADQKDRAAPPVLEFDASGKYIQGWGGVSDAYEWPDNEHGIFVDYKDNVWIGGNNPAPASGSTSPRSDDM